MAARLRIGVVLPSNNTVLERELRASLPPLVKSEFRRIRATGSGPVELRAMARQSDQAVAELARADVDVVAYACLSTSLVHPPGWDSEFIDRVRAMTGQPAVTTAQAVVSRLRSVSAQRIVVVTPYPDTIHLLAVAYLEVAGFQVLESSTFGMADIDAVGRIAPFQVELRCRDIWDAKADAIVILATDLDAYSAIRPLEDRYGVPVITANQALMRVALGLINESQRTAASSASVTKASSTEVAR